VKKEPFLTSFPLSVFATATRKIQAALRSQRERVIRNSISGYALLFESVLAPGFLEAIDPTRRQRSFGHLPVFWAWLAQVLEANASCSKALGLIQSWYQASALTVPSGGTSGYCMARMKLREDFLAQIAHRITNRLGQRIRPIDKWHGLTLKAIDGSSVQLMDTKANQNLYPQPSGQKQGCGFPVMGIHGVVNLSHGGWEGFVTCDSRRHDVRVAPRLLKHVEAEDLLLADRAYCSYELIARITGERKAHVLMRLHQARHRKLDWRRGKKISPIERLVTWKKPKRCTRSSDLTDEQWDRLPDEITLRYIKLGYENRAGEKSVLIVVTDLLDPEQHEATELSELYARRWEIEVRFRDVKTTLGMEFFSVRTPDMAHKTLQMMIIAYNLMRTLMQQAAHEADEPVHHMSFKGTLDLVTSSHETFRIFAHKPRKRRAHYNALIELCATKTIDIRPFRQEPRVRKRRPKNYQLLTESRHVFQEIPHREGYRKAA
jgi:hypothetical protein